MLLTETDAREMRCCGPDGCGQFRYPPIEGTRSHERYCVASKCMAWRWVKAMVSHGNTTQDKLVQDAHGHISFHTQHPEGQGWRQMPRRKRSLPGFTEFWRDGEPTEGFCGLAGELDTMRSKREAELNRRLAKAPSGVSTDGQ